MVSPDASGGDVLQHEWIAATMRYLDPAPRRTLDVGSGAGQLTSRLADALPDVFSIDACAATMCEARRRVGHDRASFITGTPTDIPLASATFDIAVASNGLERWNLTASDRRSALCELHRVLRPGGQILFIEQRRPEHFLDLVEEVRASPLEILSIGFLYDRPWYQLDMMLRGVQGFAVGRALRRSVTIARALRRVGRFIGPNASRHIWVLAMRRSINS